MLLSPIHCCDVTKPPSLLSGELCTSPLHSSRLSASLCSEDVILTLWVTVVGEVTSPRGTQCATFAHPCSNVLCMNPKNKDQVNNFEILSSDILIKRFILNSPEGITATSGRSSGSQEMVVSEGTPPLKQ